MNNFLSNLRRRGTGRSRLIVCVLLAAGSLWLTGCVTREIKEDPWNSPRGSVDMKKYDSAPGAEVTPGSRSYD